MLPFAGRPQPFLPLLGQLVASPVPQGELAPSLPGLMAQSQKFLDTAMASFHESTSRDELAWALQVSAVPVLCFGVL